MPKEALISLKAPSVIDWIHSDFALSREISAKAGLSYPDSSTASDMLRKYIDAHGTSAGAPWVSSTVEANAL